MFDPIPIKAPPKRILEADVEGAGKYYAKSRGFYVRKFSSPAKRSVPDDLFLKMGVCFFIEFKAPGKKATPSQLREHEKIRAQGFEVYVIDDIEACKRLIDFKDPEKC